MIYSCLIVDDEPIAREIVEGYVAQMPQLQLAQSCENAFTALHAIQSQRIDIVLLDIQMPQLSGLTLLKTLKTPPKIIITTAYHEYAIEGFELEVSDYLLKPFSLERFVKAINKVIKELTVSPPPLSPTPESATASPVAVPSSSSAKDCLFVKGEGSFIKIKFDEICYLEGWGNYVKIHTDEEMVLAHQSLTSFAAVLPTEHFVRVHKSFVVSKQKLKRIEGNELIIHHHRVPIGRSYRNEVLEKLTG